MEQPTIMLPFIQPKWERTALNRNSLSICSLPTGIDSNVSMLLLKKLVKERTVLATNAAVAFREPD